VMIEESTASIIGDKVERFCTLLARTNML